MFSPSTDNQTIYINTTSSTCITLTCALSITEQIYTLYRGRNPPPHRAAQHRQLLHSPLRAHSVLQPPPARLSGEGTRRTGYPPSAEGRGAAHTHTHAPRQPRTHGGRSDATPRQQTQTDTDNRAARVPSGSLGARGFASLASCFGGEGWDVWRPALYLGLLGITLSLTLFQLQLGKALMKAANIPPAL